MGVLTDIWNQIVDFTVRYIVEPISKIGVLDVIDILLLAILIYSLYRFFRNRRAGRMLMGLVVITVAAVAVDFAGLVALSYLVKLFAASAFFCVVVIFQPEFRDTLERIGNFSFLNLRKNGLSRRKLGVAHKMADEVVDAVFKLSNKRMGALIVFEGLTKLGDYIQTGKPVDAAITSHMLRNIFFDKAPMHDGAVVIRDMRILASSCVLPSAKTKMDYGNMGTRHRAAVGITEVSDALVIIVSEETGIVSVAQNRKLLRHLDPETLKDILLTYVAGNSYLRSKKIAAREKYQDAVDEKWTSMMRENRSKNQASASQSKNEAVKAPEHEAAVEQIAEETLKDTDHQSTDTEDDSKL